MSRDTWLSCVVTAEVKKRFRMVAAEMDMSMSELLAELVEEYVNEFEAAKK